MTTIVLDYKKQCILKVSKKLKKLKLYTLWKV